MSDKPKDPNELGALWLKTGPKGEYMTGSINGVNVVCFWNKHHVEGDNKPAWRVLKSQPREERQARDRGPERRPSQVDAIDEDLGF